jgi:hypothetical protein
MHDGQTDALGEVATVTERAAARSELVQSVIEAVFHSSEAETE